MMISHFETGVRKGASAATLVNLANALSVSVDYLLGRVDSPSPVGGQVGALLRSVEGASGDVIDNLVIIAKSLTAKEQRPSRGRSDGPPDEPASKRER